MTNCEVCRTVLSFRNLGVTIIDNVCILKRIDLVLMTIVTFGMFIVPMK